MFSFWPSIRGDPYPQMVPHMWMGLRCKELTHEILPHSVIAPWINCQEIIKLTILIQQGKTQWSGWYVQWTLSIHGRPPRSSVWIYDNFPIYLRCWNDESGYALEESREGHLLLVAVAPINSKFDRSALIILLYWPVMVYRHQSSCEEVIVSRFHDQSKRIAS